MPLSHCHGRAPLQDPRQSSAPPRPALTTTHPHSAHPGHPPPPQPIHITVDAITLHVAHQWPQLVEPLLTLSSPHCRVPRLPSRAPFVPEHSPPVALQFARGIMASSGCTCAVSWSKRGMVRSSTRDPRESSLQMSRNDCAVAPAVTPAQKQKRSRVEVLQSLMTLPVCVHVRPKPVRGLEMVRL